MNQLLNKTLLYHAIISTVVLLLSAPFFYAMMERLHVDDVDEAILLRQEEFHQYNLPTLQKKDIATWNKFNRDIWLLPDTVTKPVGQIQEAVFLDTLSQEWEPYRVLYDRVFINQEPFILRIRINLVESEDLIMALSKLYLGIILLLMLVLFLITRYNSKRLWAPFYKTLQQIEQFNLEQATMPEFSDTSTEEFKKLNQGLTKLIQTNLNTYRTQKEFTENAAHELQTPLAIFQSKLDLLIQNPAINQEQAQIILALYEASSRLSRINKNLLLLAKIENKHFSDWQDIDLGKIITEVIPYFSEQANSRHLDIHTNIAERVVAQKVSKGLVEILINNLLLNAIRHNHLAGRIAITLTASHLTIANTGIPYPLSEKNLFRRFAKTSENTQSSGLGLAIVNHICQLHDWTVRYQFTGEQHQFSVIF